MKINLLVYLTGLLLIFFSSCDTVEPEFNPDKIFIEVKNGTIDSNGEFEIFNYSSKPIFIHHFMFPFCSFFTYSVEKLTDSGYINLIFDERVGNWVTEVITPDSILSICEIVVMPVEVKPLDSFKQRIHGVNEVGDYKLNINYSLSETYSSQTYLLSPVYKVIY